MAVNPIASSPIGSILPPGVKPDASEVVGLCAQLDLVHVQVKASLTPTPQRVADLLNAYLDAVRRLHGNPVPYKILVNYTRSGSMPPNVCLHPSPGGPVPLPYPNIPSSSATKTDPGNEQARKIKLEMAHQQIKSSTNATPQDTSGLVNAYLRAAVPCWIMIGTPVVRTELGMMGITVNPFLHNRLP